MSNRDFWVLMDAYKEQFGEYFPLMEVFGMEDDTIADMIKKCIDSGKPYEAEEKEGVFR